MASPEAYSAIGLAEAYALLRMIRAETASANATIERAQDLLKQAAAASLLVEQRLKTAGVVVRWHDDRLEVLAPDGSWQAGPSLTGPMALGVETRWQGSVLQVRDSQGVWQSSPDLRGPPGRWSADAAFRLAQRRFNQSTPHLTLDLEAANTFRPVLLCPITQVTFAGLDSVTPAQTMRWAVHFEQGPSGFAPVTGWPNSVQWSDDVPALASLPGAVDLLIFDYDGYTGVVRGAVGAEWAA